MVMVEPATVDVLDPAPPEALVAVQSTDDGL
jgi:hypothetical protein